MAELRQDPRPLYYLSVSPYRWPRVASGLITMLARSFEILIFKKQTKGRQGPLGPTIYNTHKQGSQPRMVQCPDKSFSQ